MTRTIGLALAATVAATLSTTASQDVALRELMPKGLVIGVAISQRQSDGTDAAGVDLVTSQFNQVSPENLLMQAPAWVFQGTGGHGLKADPPGVAVLQVDLDRRMGSIDRHIYGQFLEHINHSVVDGLFAEQVRGAGFEGKDFDDYWTPFGRTGRRDASRAGRSSAASKSVRISTAGRTGWDPAGPRVSRVRPHLRRVGLDQARIRGAPRLSFAILAADGTVADRRAR